MVCKLVLWWWGQVRTAAEDEKAVQTYKGFGREEEAGEGLVNALEISKSGLGKSSMRVIHFSKHVYQ